MIPPGVEPSDRRNPGLIQAHWLERVLAEEHERDKKHSDLIELPD